MSSFDQRPASKFPTWVIALAVFWGLASLAGLFFVGKKIISTVRRQQDFRLREVGPEERALALTDEELVQSGLWHATKKPPREVELKLDPGGSMIATHRGTEGNHLVIEAIVVRSGPSWISETVLHQSARLAFSKQGLTEKTEPPIGPDHYPSYRYCKGDQCKTWVVIATLDQSGIYLSTYGDAAPEPEQLAAVMKASLVRVVDYSKRHALFELDGGS